MFVRVYEFVCECSGIFVYVRLCMGVCESVSECACVCVY